jgi:hypothetical protein
MASNQGQVGIHPGNLVQILRNEDALSTAGMVKVNLVAFSMIERLLKKTG